MTLHVTVQHCSNSILFSIPYNSNIDDNNDNDNQNNIKRYFLSNNV